MPWSYNHFRLPEASPFCGRLVAIEGSVMPISLGVLATRRGRAHNERNAKHRTTNGQTSKIHHDCNAFSHRTNAPDYARLEGD
jgi:hypothetical protein